MKHWEKFANKKITRILNEKKSVIDIGGGLRILRKKGNRYEKSKKWIEDLIIQNKVDYKILDPIPDYNPDVIGDIHNLPFSDNSQDAIICIAVLEHVENPIKACMEMYRVLKPGGYCFVYVPFLYYFHAEKEYYHDYWRFTKDAVGLLFKNFSTIDVCGVRGAISTWLHISPFGRVKFLVMIADALDILFGKRASNQVSGYSIFLIK